VECWASSLGDCAAGISGEHYISRGIFEAKSVTVKGLPWCREKPIEIGLGSAVAKILCEKHNSALSNFDTEAATLSRFLEHNVLDNPLIETSISLDGRHIEKWALKTFLNLGYMRALHPGQEQNLIPPNYLVEHIYRGTPIPEGAGLYFISGPVNNRDFNSGISWNVIRNQKKMAIGIHEVLGMVFVLFGIRFAISTEPGQAEEKLKQMGKVGDFDYSQASVYYRPDNIVMNSKTAGVKRILFKW
jgi:hypothetical protein